MQSRQATLLMTGTLRRSSPHAATGCLHLPSGPPSPATPNSLALAVIDAIWSVGTRYAITTGVISRYTSYRQRMGGDATHDGLTDLLGLYDRLGGIDGFIDEVGTRNRVSTQPGATLKGAAVHQAATALLGLGIDTAAQFLAAEATDLEDQARVAWTAVPGQSSGTSWRYLRMLLGLPDVKPDRMLIRFIASALGVDERTLGREHVVQLVRTAAERLGADQRALDHAIWTYQTTGHHTHGGSSGAEHIKTLAHAFIGSAFPVLAQQHVIPTSIYQPFVQVGHDYAGDDFMPRTEFRELESALEQAYPGRFAEPLKRPHAEFANGYVFSFLEAAVARCAVGGGVFEADSAPVAESADELISVLDSDEYTIHCCRAVSHITTADEEPVQIGDVTIYPETGTRDLVERAQRLIPAIPTAFGGDLPFIYAPPHALLVSVASSTYSDDPYAAAQRASATISRFLLLARLLYAGTHQSCWEVTGAPTLVAGMHPQTRAFGAVKLFTLKRVVRLSADDAPAFAALSDSVNAAVIKRAGMTATSFDTALYRYNRAHEEGDDFERIVDLATALEAVLTGDDKGEGLSLRLRNRAVALLATGTDSGTAIFNDITKLYDLRSRLVHGGSIPEKDLRKIVMAVSTVPDDAMFGVALALAVDRMRDLVRRSFLARLCLASSTDPLWPFGKSTPVDAALADDTTRAQWRTHWRDQLAALHMAAAADPASQGTDPPTRPNSS